nr:MAG TPA: hypothetical protein [Caudoviricetes sp.]
MRSFLRYIRINLICLGLASDNNLFNSFKSSLLLFMLHPFCYPAQTKIAM